MSVTEERQQQLSLKARVGETTARAGTPAAVNAQKVRIGDKQSFRTLCPTY